MSRALRIAVLLLAVGAVGACGDDDSGGTELGAVDAAMPHDAAADAALDAAVTPPPPDEMKDAGHDAGGQDAAKPPVDVDDDAGTPKCSERLCKAMSDECHVARCDDKTAECKLSARPNGTTCGSSVLDNCTLPDTCQAGVCKANDSAEGRPCGDQSVDCHKNDACDGHGKCGDKGLKAKGSACGDRTTENECDALDTCDSKGACQPNFAAVEAPCGDQNQLCRNNDQCDGQGQCIDGGAWMPGQCPQGAASGGACLCRPAVAGTTCHPNADVCAGSVCVFGNAEDGIACGGPDPTDAECDAADSCQGGTCSQNNQPSSVACGDHATHGACDLPDHCDGSGSCSTNYASSLTTCGNAPSDCEQEPLCNGAGSCQSAQPAELGTACGSATDTDCNHADTCDGSGDCQENLAAANSACGDQSTTECTTPDTCSAAGVCQPHNAPEGTDCGDQGQLCKLDDSCDSNGICADQGETATCGISGTVVAGGSGVPGVVIEILGTGATSATTDQDGNYQLTVPLTQLTVVRVHEATGYWGFVQPVKFSASDASRSVDFELYADAYLATVASLPTPSVSVNTAKGLLLAQFSGAHLTGDEGLTASPASSTPPAIADTGQFVRSTTIMNTSYGVMYFYNMQLATTTLTPSAGCAFAPAFGTQVPMFAHSMTAVTLVCN